MKFFVFFVALIAFFQFSHVESQVVDSLISSSVSTMQSTTCSFQGTSRNLLNIVMQQIQSVGAVLLGQFNAVGNKFTALQSNSVYTTYVATLKSLFQQMTQNTNTMCSNFNTQSSAATTPGVSNLNTMRSTYAGQVTVNTNPNAPTCENAQIGSTITSIFTQQATISSTQSGWTTAFFSCFSSLFSQAISTLVAGYQMFGSLLTCQYTASDNGTCVLGVITSTASTSPNFTALAAAFMTAVTSCNSSVISSSSNATIYTATTTLNTTLTTTISCVQSSSS